ncbi:hypothetical protein CXB51_023783 [Gossypium anomalum]|uniref:DDE Tnp4 domain-containing protein n=2 Tax=Gossypium TaxID=3633 RepID=A0A8J6CV02_9ROSI|nr:hypothetical protein CXB51_023783 [Gossypium anomalum]
MEEVENLFAIKNLFIENLCQGGDWWNPIKRTVDASDDWWESRLKVVPEAQKFRTSGIDPEFEGKLDQMFMGIVATGDKAWALSSSTLRSDIFEDVNNEIPEENEEENVRNDVRILNDVHISNDVHIDGNGQKKKNPEISSSHFKTGRKKSSKQIGGAARLSSQIEKLCNAADNMSQPTSSLTPVLDPYGIPQAVKVLNSMSKEVPEATFVPTEPTLKGRSHLHIHVSCSDLDGEDKGGLLMAEQVAVGGRGKGRPRGGGYWALVAWAKIGTVMSIVENYSSDDSDDEREKIEILQRMECFNRLFVVASSFVQLYYEKYILKQPCMNSKQSGETWIREILDGHESRCMINFRMSKMVFTSLLRVLETRYNLQTSRNISSSEMLGIFLYILGTGAKVSQCRERFQRSGSTISQYFAIVLEKVSRMATDLIAPEDPFFSSIPEQIRNDSRYMPHFKDCIGAIDGTHIAAILPPNEQIPYIGRKGIPTQNVMAVCDFNMCSTFVMAGWEGSAHDTRIFLDAIRDPKYKFPHPPNGKYYLVDSGYPQMKGYLGPYRGQRYHLPDFRRGRPASGKEEVFNHSYSSLRSVIERTFSILKKKWAILRDMPSYSFEKQTMIVVAAMTIHNFIRKHAGRNDADFMEYEDINWAYENNIDLEIVHGRESDDDDDDDDDGDDDGESNNSSGFEMELTRDAIASSLMNSL